MSVPRARVRFQEEHGRLRAVEVRRSGARPIISALHRSLFAIGVVVTSYQVQARRDGLSERMELASLDGRELDAAQAEEARTAILPLAFESE